MKTEMTEELMVRWVDHDLSPDELALVEQRMSEDEGLRRDLHQSKRIAEVVRANVPNSVEPPYGDFFNSQLMRKVDLAKERKDSLRAGKPWWDVIRWSWVPIGALAMAVSFLAGNRFARPAGGEMTASALMKQEVITSTVVYSAGKDLEAKVVADASGEISAIVVNGLSALRDDFDSQTVSQISTPRNAPVSDAPSKPKRFF